VLSLYTPNSLSHTKEPKTLCSAQPWPAATIGGCWYSFGWYARKELLVEHLFEEPYSVLRGF